MNNTLSVVILLLMVGPAIGQITPGHDVRTVSPTERGLSESDFPRVQNIADGVYTFEALTGPADDRYTTNSMFVITDAGVLVAYGQGSVEETHLLVTAIGEITDPPINHVIICSDHRDHTNGNSAFPDGTEFIARRISLPALTKAAESGGLLPGSHTR